MLSRSIPQVPRSQSEEAGQHLENYRWCYVKKGGGSNDSRHVVYLIMAAVRPLTLAVWVAWHVPSAIHPDSL
jgi:hypothetical protein